MICEIAEKYYTIVEIKGSSIKLDIFEKQMIT